MQRVLGAMSLFADNTHTQVWRSWNPHTLVRSANHPYDNTAALLWTISLWNVWIPRQHKEWRRNSSAHSVRVALNNLFRRIFDCCRRENPKSLLFYCGTLPALYTVDQRRILFYKKLKHHTRILIRTIARFCQHGILSVAAKYGINRLENSVFSIHMADICCICCIGF